MPWTLEQAADQTGRRILITGSNTGIGYATAVLLARKGARIVLACRNADKGRAALTRLRADVAGVDAELVPLDLANLRSVREAAAMLEAQNQPIDTLINNAGLMMPPLARTADGFELQFGTNVLGHFAFTGLVLPLLEKNPAARVVWLSSVARWGAYAQSKLADLMLAYEMQRRLERGGATMISMAAHPGGTKSELSRHNALLRVINALTARVLQDAQAGAMPSVRAATDPNARGGDYYGPGGLGTMSGPATRQRSSKRSHDGAVAARLWQRCEELTGVRWLS
jgi:NAD(P)-dependent dehydrogenase (short-subunit alcohol dehydrogenase family)